MSEEKKVLAICPRCKGNGYFNNDIQCPQCNSSGWALINKSQAYKNCYGTYESIALLLLSCLAFFVVDLFLALMLASLAIVRLIVKVWKLEDL
jgi:hypothetical protein